MKEIFSFFKKTFSLMRHDILRKFENIQLISNRISQLEQNAPTTLKKEELEELHLDKCIGFLEKAEKIAKEELRQGKLPLTLERRLVNGESEQWMTENLSNPWN